MTRANTEQAKYVPWFAKAGAACSIVPIARFVNDNLFALKGGGYGCLFQLSGLDEEGLTDQELESHLRMIEGALRGLPEGACLYQYTRVRSGYDLPRQLCYANPVTHAFVSDRLEFLERTAGFRRIDLHWCLTLEPSKVKSFERTPAENAASTSRILAELEKTAALLVGNLASSIGLRLLDKQSAFQFFSYLFNLQDWAEWGQLREDTNVDRQIVQIPVAWESDHLRIGRRFVQMYSLKTTPEASRPCLFTDLLKLDCNSILCTTWRPKSTATARHEIDQQEKFISFFKVGVLSRVMAGKDTASLDTGAGANRFGETNGITTAFNSNSPSASSMGWNAATVPVTSDLTTYIGNQTPGSPQMAQLAMIEMSDAVSPDCITAVGQYRAARSQNLTANNSLAANQLDGTSATNSEVQQLNLLNAAEAQKMAEMQSQGTIQTCIASQMAVANMQQRNAAATDLNTAVFVQTQHATHDMSAASESNTWQTYLP